MGETSGEFQSPTPKQQESFFSKLKNKFRSPTSPVQELKTIEPASSNDTDLDRAFKKLDEMLGPPTIPSRPPESTEELISRMQNEEQKRLNILNAAREREKANTKEIQKTLNDHYLRNATPLDIPKK